MLFSALWETTLQQQQVPVGVNARLAASACLTSATWLDSCRQLRFAPASVGADGRAGRRAAPRCRADLHSIHLLMDGHVLRNVAPGLVPQDLTYLAKHGARQAGPEPAKAAIELRGGPRPS